VNGDAEQVVNVLSARDFIGRWYETLATTQPHETDYTIGTTAVPIGTAYGQRLAFSLSNTGATNIAFGWNPALTISTGFLLLSGGYAYANWLWDLEVVALPLYAIGSGAGGTLHMMENILAGA